MQEDVTRRRRRRDRAGGPEARRQPPARRRGRAARARSCCRPARCSTPQHVALAAALGLTELEVRRRLHGRDLLDRRRDRRAGQPRAPAPRSTTPTATLLRGCSTGSARTSPISASCRTTRSALARALADAARDHDLVLTSGGVSTGEADHVRSAVERVGSLVFWRVAIKPGRPVAMGVIRGADGTAPPSSACRAIRSRCS